jgi:methyl-accepting chemotaxis protein
VASAMAHIAQAMDQNMAGTAQLESAARKLEELGGSLKQLIERYKV